MNKTDLKMKTELSSLYGRSASMLSTPLYIVASLSNDEVLQKVRMSFRRVLCNIGISNTWALYYVIYTEGLVYGLFIADRLNMKDYESFSYTLDLMKNELLREWEVC